MTKKFLRIYHLYLNSKGVISVIHFKVKINHTRFKNKPTSEEIAKIAKHFTTTTLNPHLLKKAIESGKSILPCVTNEFGEFYQQVFFVDVDNNTNETFRSVTRNLQKAQANMLPPILIYPTFSYTPANQKHRMIFLFDRAIDDAVTRDRIQIFLNNTFMGDSRTKNKKRIFYGTSKRAFFSSKSAIDTDAILKRIEVTSYDTI